MMRLARGASEAKGSMVSSGFCQVLGTRAQFLDVEVELPDNWSGCHFQSAAGGGFDGLIYSATTLDSGGDVIALSPVLSGKAGLYVASNGVGASRKSSRFEERAD